VKRRALAGLAWPGGNGQDIQAAPRGLRLSGSPRCGCGCGGAVVVQPAAAAAASARRPRRD